MSALRLESARQMMLAAVSAPAQTSMHGNAWLRASWTFIGNKELLGSVQTSSRRGLAKKVPVEEEEKTQKEG